MRVRPSWPVSRSVSTTRSTMSSTARIDRSRCRCSASSWATCRSSSGGRERIGPGLSPTSASLNDGGRGSLASANRPAWRGAGVDGWCGLSGAR